MKFTTAFFGFALASLPLASGAGLVVNFDSYTSGQDLAGQGGWTISANDTNSGVSWVESSPFPSGGSNAGQLGFQEIDGMSASVSHGLSQVLDGSTFSVTTLIQDSTNTFPERDQFGFSLRSAGQELFGIYFTPTEQTSTPNGLGTPRVDNITWSNFTTGTSSVIGSLTEGNFTTLSVTFTTISADSVEFALSSAGSLVLTQTINSTGIGGATIDEFSVVWNLFDTVDGFEGGNSIYFDNLSIVPEPSVALLGLIGVFAGFRRRRN